MKFNKILTALGSRGMLKILTDKMYLKLVYKSIFNKKLDLKNPKTFSEKIQWLKLNDRREEYITFVDKILVRSYIENFIGKEYLIPALGYYNKVSDIPWDQLPKRFVIKCTHGSKSNIVCFDKDSLNIKKSERQLKKWMNKNWFWYGRAWPYKKIKPRILIEEFISSNENTPDDYKILCFNGKARLIELHHDRFGQHTQDFYDMNWNKTSISQFNSSSNSSNKPYLFDEMIYLSEKISKGYPHLRIDWYVVENKLYFGEITLYDGSGFTKFENPDDDLFIGQWLDLGEYR